MNQQTDTVQIKVIIATQITDAENVTNAANETSQTNATDAVKETGVTNKINAINETDTTKEYVLTGKSGMSIMGIINSRPGFNFAFPCNGNGKCGKCVIKVLEGYFDITPEDRKFFDENKLNEGYRLACKAVVTSDCVIEYHGIIEENYEIQSAFVDIKPAGGNYTDESDVANSSENLNAGSAANTANTVNKSAESTANTANTVNKSAESAASTANTVNKSAESAANTANTVNKSAESAANEKYGIAIDIGTTTIAAALVGKRDGKVVKTYTTLNRQRRFGADVIARIQASNDGHGEELRASVIKDLTECIRALVAGNECTIDRIVIAGNTTMEHLLLGYSCETLGVFPFTPVDIKSKTLKFEDIFGKSGIQQLSAVDVLVMPGISTYVGADIAAGILHCGIDEASEVSLLIDLGTNGEMAIGNKDKILVTSTAAGPAFEGGNISCGTGSIDGAIYDVKIDNTDFSKVYLKTINNAQIAGLCGTGVIAVTAELLKNEIVDETGRLDEEFFDDGFVLGRTNRDEIISFTQKDVREIQLAKSAIRAGAETLILRYGIDKYQIKNVYLAGGFGYHINLENAIEIGLLPEEFSDRIVAVGNSSLGGAVNVIRDWNNSGKLDKICDMAEEISLSDDRDFQEFYMDYMMFEED